MQLIHFVTAVVLKSLFLDYVGSSGVAYLTTYPNFQSNIIILYAYTRIKYNLKTVITLIKRKQIDL